MRLRTLLAVAALSALTITCYKIPQPPCAFRCGAAGECPTDYTCRAEDGLCHLVLDGQMLECPLVNAIDAGTTPDIDAPDTIDAPPGTPDAKPAIDAPPAVIDAKPAVDAPPPMIDAPPPMIDAPPPMIDAAPAIDAKPAIDA